MLKLVVLAVLLTMLVSVIMIAMMLLVVAAITAAIVVPLYLLARQALQGRTTRPTLKPVDRLQNLFAEGKIDLFEFERRVAQLITLEH
jgi:hypothetical protein